MRPDLARVYAASASRPRRPVVVIPGVFGSRLADARTGRVVWGRTASLFTRLYRPWDAEWDLLDLPVDDPGLLGNRDHLEPAGIFDKVAGREFYARLLGVLKDHGNYTPGDVRDPKPGQDLFTFDYDWRRDAAETAARLSEAIEKILAARGEPGGQVDLLGHSFGGILARYYVLYGGEDVLASPSPGPTFAGARRVRTLVYLGAPNAGTLDALRSLVDGARLVRLLPAEAVFTMPAAYQLLPHPGQEVLLDGAGKALVADLFDPGTWERFGWSVFDPERMEARRREAIRRHGRAGAGARLAGEMETLRAFLGSALGRAARLARAIEAGGGAPGPVRAVAFGGDCLPTPARAVILHDGIRHRTHFVPGTLPRALRRPGLEALMMEPGDGSVTRASLMGVHTGPPGSTPEAVEPLQLHSATFLCEGHRRLTENITFQDNLLHVLLERPF
jgi:hypothetical protein